MQGGHGIASDIRPRTAALVLGTIVLASLGLRLAHLVEIEKDVLYRYALLDEAYYWDAARSLIENGSVGAPFWRPPGLQFAMAFILEGLGSGLRNIRLVQIVLSCLSCVLVFLLALRVTSIRGALWAAGLTAVHGVLIEFSTALKAPTWILFFDLGALLLLLGAREKRSLARALGAGLFLGVSALFKPLVLLFVPAAFVWLVWKTRRRALLGPALLVGTLIPILPVTVQNVRAGSGFELISTNGGVNFYIGNNPDYLETVTARPGKDWDQVVLKSASDAGLGSPGPERSRFYYRLALDHILKDPLAAAGRGVRKLYLFLNGREIPRDTDVYLSREDSWVIRFLVQDGWPFWPDGLIIPLALLGIFVSVRRTSAARLFALFLLFQAVAVSAFFVAARYRVPSIPLLCIFAVIGAAWVLLQFRAGTWARKALVLGTLGVLLVGLNLPTAETAQDFRAEKLYFRANNLDREGRRQEALAMYRQSVALDSTDARVWQTMGIALIRAGNLAEAAESVERAAALDPRNPRPRDVLLEIYRGQGDFDSAVEVVRKDMEAFSEFPDRRAFDLYRIGKLRYEQGQFDRALRAFAEAESTDPEVTRKNLTAWISGVLQNEDSGKRKGEGEFWEALAGKLEFLPELQDRVREHAQRLREEDSPD